MNKNIAAVITDLDGTLLNSQKKVSSRDFECLLCLGKENICRIIATGRSIFSFLKVIPKDFPIDYLVFSSGAGIMDWKNKRIIFQENIITENLHDIESLFHSYKLDFFIQHPIPNNHFFESFQYNLDNKDFIRRKKIYINCDIPIKREDGASQFIAVENHIKGHQLYPDIKEKLPALKVIKATSPIDNKSRFLQNMGSVNFAVLFT